MLFPPQPTRRDGRTPILGLTLRDNGADARNMLTLDAAVGALDLGLTAAGAAGSNYWADNPTNALLSPVSPRSVVLTGTPNPSLYFGDPLVGTVPGLQASSGALLATVGASGSVQVLVGGATKLIVGPNQVNCPVPLLLAADPLVPLAAATKQYVDAHTGGTNYWTDDAPNTLLSPATSGRSLSLKGAGTSLYLGDPLLGVVPSLTNVAGNLHLIAPPAATVNVTVGATVVYRADVAKGTHLLPLLLAADPTLALGATTKQYVDARTGPILWADDPVNVLLKPVAARNLAVTGSPNPAIFFGDPLAATIPFIQATPTVLTLNAPTAGDVRLVVAGTPKLTVTATAATFAGAITVGTTSTPVAGTIRWDGTHFQGYNGTAWLQLDN